MTALTHSVEIKAPIERVYAVLTDFERYPKFLPGCEGVEILSQTKSRARVHFKVNMMKHIEYTLDFKLAAPKSVIWKLVEGDMMTANDGVWKLAAVDKENTTARFDFEVKFPFYIPSSLVDSAIQKTMPTIMANLKKEAERKK